MDPIGENKSYLCRPLSQPLCRGSVETLTDFEGLDIPTCWYAPATGPTANFDAHLTKTADSKRFSNLATVYPQNRASWKSPDNHLAARFNFAI